MKIAVGTTEPYSWYKNTGNLVLIISKPQVHSTKDIKPFHRSKVLKGTFTIGLLL